MSNKIVWGKYCRNCFDVLTKANLLQKSLNNKYINEKVPVHPSNRIPSDRMTFGRMTQLAWNCSSITILCDRQLAPLEYLSPLSIQKHLFSVHQESSFTQLMVTLLIISSLIINFLKALECPGCVMRISRSELLTRLHGSFTVALKYAQVVPASWRRHGPFCISYVQCILSIKPMLEKLESLFYFDIFKMFNYSLNLLI